MSNPPPYPGGTLTEKFTALSEEVEQYISTINNKLDNITAAQADANTKLSAILAAIQALTPIIQQAANCSCAAAEALEGAPWNEEPPPPPVLCDDPQADPMELTFAEFSGSGSGLWEEENGFQANWSTLGLPLTTGQDGNGNLYLSGPSWYHIVATLAPGGASLNVNGSNVGSGPGFDRTVTNADVPSVIDEYFFIADGDELILQVTLFFNGGEPNDSINSSLILGLCDPGGGA